MHRRAELEGNLRRKPNPKGAQAGARKRSEESDEAVVAGKRSNARGAKGLCVQKGRCKSNGENNNVERLQ